MPWPRGDRFPQAGRRRRGHPFKRPERVGWDTCTRGRPRRRRHLPSVALGETLGVPAVAVSICQVCGSADERALVGHNTLTTMPPCSCGGRMQVSRIFYDRCITHEPARAGRETP